MKLQPTSVIKIGLLGPYGFGNLGDAAIQEAVIKNIRRYLPNTQIYGFSLNPKDTRERHNIESFPIIRSADSNNGQRLQASEDRITFKERLRRVSKRGLKRVLKAIVISDSVYLRLWAIWKEILFISKSYKILKTIDILIISGGGQLDDYWGGAWGHPYTLFKWAIMARVAKKRFIFMSVGVDSITFKLSKFFIKHSLLLASYRSYRERNTLMIVEAMGVRPGGMVYPDLAFSLPVNRDRVISCLEMKKSPIIGISPISTKAYTAKDDPVHRNYFNQLVSIVSWLVEKNYKILFFPTQIKMDTPMIADLKEALFNRGILKSKNQIIENRILTVDDLIEQILIVDIVVASRLHAVILSLLMHKPVLAISYNRKVNILMEDMGLSEYCIDFNHMDLHISLKKFMLLEADADTITEKIRNKVAAFTKDLDCQYGCLFERQNSPEIC